MGQPPTILFTAAEASGDQHAANLVAAIRARRPDIRCVALGGPRLAAAGAELLADLTSRSAMLLGSAVRVPEMLGHYARFGRLLDRHGVGLHVPVDSPAVNLPLAGVSKRRGRPVLYYIAPQLWAWGAWRMAKLARRVDRLACILPFEPDYFAAHGLAGEFVGHPLFEPLIDYRPDEAFIAALPAGSPKIALLPGSRGHEIADHLPAMLRVAGEVRRRHLGSAFALAAPARLHGHALKLDSFLADAPAGLDLAVVPGRMHDVLAWADAAVVVSGSATLEVAHFGVPMVIVYRVGRWQWRLIGRRLVKTEFLSLVNILAGRRLVPELMPWLGDDREIVDALDGLLSDASARERMSHELTELVAPLARTRASQRTAELAIELLDGGAGG